MPTVQFFGIREVKYMTQKLIELNVGQKGTILVAVDVPEQTISPLAKTGDIVIDKVDEKFDDIKYAIINGCRPLTEAFEALYREGKAKNAEVEFGLSFTGKGNIYVVETSAQASLKVKITWDLHKIYGSTT